MTQKVEYWSSWKWKKNASIARSGHILLSIDLLATPYPNSPPSKSLYYPKCRNKQDNGTFDHWLITACKYLKWCSFTKRNCSNYNLTKHSMLLRSKAKQREPMHLTFPCNHCLTKIIRITANKLSHVIKPRHSCNKQCEPRWEPPWHTFFLWLGKVASLTKPSFWPRHVYTDWTKLICSILKWARPNCTQGPNVVCDHVNPFIQHLHTRMMAFI